MTDLHILENLLVENGRIIDHKILSREYSHLSNINNKISSLIKRGLLIKLQKGVYYIAKLGSLGYTSTSAYVLANTIGEESFVSFEAALKYHGIFDQGLKTYRSISKQQYLTKKIEEIEYRYVTIKRDNYFGFVEEQIDSNTARVASTERALLDLIEYQRTIHSVSLVLEKVNVNFADLNIEMLLSYLKHYSQICIKTWGLMFDLLHLDSSEIYELLDSHQSTHKLLKSSDTYNSHWRLYYDVILDKQAK